MAKLNYIISCRRLDLTIGAWRSEHDVRVEAVDDEDGVSRGDALLAVTVTVLPRHSGDTTFTHRGKLVQAYFCETDYSFAGY